MLLLLVNVLLAWMLVVVLRVSLIQFDVPRGRGALISLGAPTRDGAGLSMMGISKHKDMVALG